MRHTLWTGISETNVNVITSATRTHAFNNNNNNNNNNNSLKLKLQYHLYSKMAIPGEICVVLQPSLEKRLYVHVTDLVYIEIET